MSLMLSILADILVAVLLVASIATSWTLSRRMHRLKADEAAMRTVVAELMVATDSAERAIAGLRATVAECDRTLAERLRLAERHSADLAGHVVAGEAIIDRVSQIAEMSRRLGAAAARPEDGARAPAAEERAADPLRSAVMAARDLAVRAARRVEGRAA